MNLRSTLQQLTQAGGPSGQEANVAALVAEMMKPFCDEVQVDSLFSVIGLKNGAGSEPRPKLALMAHIDEVYLLVTAVEGAFLRFTQHGYDPRLLVGQEVKILGKQPLFGVIGDRPPHLLTGNERAQMPRTEDLVIDLGLEAEEVTAKVSVGDSVLLRGSDGEASLVALLAERVAGKALDNRLGVATLLATLDILQGLRHPCDVLAIANGGEELNHLGAQTSAYRLLPDLAIIIDVTFGDQPGVESNQSFGLGRGPVVGIGPSLHPVIAAGLADAAAALEMEYATEPLPANTGTDAWEVEVAAGGIPCGLLSIPLRNMHSPVEVADLRDATRAARLLAGFVAQVDSSFVANLTYKLPDFDEATP